jgi:hypothetical protein
MQIFCLCGQTNDTCSIHCNGKSQLWWFILTLQQKSECTVLIRNQRVPWDGVILQKSNGSSTKIEILPTYVTPKFHYRVHKDQTNPAPPPKHRTRSPTGCFKIHFSIILPSYPKPFKGCLSFRFPQPNSLYTPVLPHTPRKNHLSWFCVLRSVQLM